VIRESGLFRQGNVVVAVVDQLPVGHTLMVIEQESFQLAAGIVAGRHTHKQRHSPVQLGSSRVALVGSGVVAMAEVRLGNF